MFTRMKDRKGRGDEGLRNEEENRRQEMAMKSRDGKRQQKWFQKLQGETATKGREKECG